MARTWYRNVHTGKLAFFHHTADSGRIALFDAVMVVAVVTAADLRKHWERVK